MTCEGPLPCRWPCPVGGWGGVGLQQDASRGHSADSGCGPGPPAAAWPLGGHAAAHLSLHPDGAVPTNPAGVLGVSITDPPAPGLGRTPPTPVSSASHGRPGAPWSKASALAETGPPPPAHSGSLPPAPAAPLARGHPRLPPRPPIIL